MTLANLGVRRYVAKADGADYCYSPVEGVKQSVFFMYEKRIVLVQTSVMKKLSAQILRLST